MRVAIVNDLALATETLRRLLLEMPGVQIAWTALDGAEAVRRAAADPPDLILMDMVMPVMDGPEATRRIMRECPCPIVVVTATVGGNADRVFAALSAGALDATETPSIGAGWAPARAQLLRKIEQVRRLKGIGTPSAPRTAGLAPATAPVPCPPLAGRPLNPALRLAAIGASTGGPQALATVLGSIPKDFPFAIVAVQHLDPSFVPGLVSWLSRETGRRVEAAVCGAVARAGVCSIAANDEHLLVLPGGRFGESPEPAESVHRPSVDVLFQSLVHSRLPPFAAALLTGMGHDGADGLLALRRAGWTTLAQDKASSVVWGMPGAADRLGAAVKTLPIDAIGPELVRLAALPARENIRS